MTGIVWSDCWRHTLGRCMEACAGGFAGVIGSCTDLGGAFGSWYIFSVGTQVVIEKSHKLCLVLALQACHRSNTTLKTKVSNWVCADL